MATSANGPAVEGRPGIGWCWQRLGIAALVALALLVAGGTALLVVEVGKGMTALRQERERDKQLQQQVAAMELQRQAEQIKLLIDAMPEDPPERGCPRPPKVTAEDLEHVGRLLKEALQEKVKKDEPANGGR